MWFTKVDHVLSRNILAKSRQPVSTLVQLFTGHNFLRKHLGTLDPTVSTSCRLCGNGIEDTEHIVTQCDPLWRERQDLDLDSQIPFKWSLKKLTRFIHTTKVANLLKPPTEEN